MNERIVSLTTELVAIPSHETEQAAQEHLGAVLREAGFDVRFQEISPGRPNLIARRGDGGAFLSSHIDTHPPHGHPDPFTCRQTGEMLTGRGVLDAKGQIAALVAAAESEPDMPATVVITCDEETGGTGSEHLDLPDGPWLEDGGIVLEPTDLRFCTAQGGHVDLVLEASAPPTHAYAPRATIVSPVEFMIGAVHALRSIGALRARHPLLLPPRLHIGRIDGGEHLWRTPARCRAEVAIGLVPGVTVDEAKEQIATVLQRAAADWGVEGASFLYDVADASEPVEVPADLHAASWIADAPGTPIAPGGMISWTDAANLLTHHGLPCVVIGAGRLVTAHSDGETVAVADLVRLAEILRSVLRSAGTAR